MNNWKQPVDPNIEWPLLEYYEAQMGTDERGEEEHKERENSFSLLATLSE